MTKQTFLQVLAVALAASAAYVSYNLFLKHVPGSATPGWFDAGCSPAAESKFNCKEALQSPYAYWPPKLPDDPPEKGHLPVAFLGMVYFLVLTVWLVGVGRPSLSRRWLHLIPLILVTFGLLGSAMFLYFMFTKLNQWCPWCLLTHVLNIVLAATLVLLWPRTPKPATQRTAPEAGNTGIRAAEIEEPRHPTSRQLVTTILACVLAFVAANHFSAKSSALVESAIYRTAIDRIRGDSLKLFANWKFAEKKEISVRTDDPARHGSDRKAPAMELVVFSDFQCPSCTLFAGFLQKTIEPMFDQHLRVVFKHLPFDTQCNPHLDESMHAHACFAAKIAEAARLTSGNAGFWRVHDFFFEHRDDLERGKLTLEQVANATSLDPNPLKEKMEDPSILERIHEDIELAKSLEIQGTPAVFVDGKRVDELAVKEIGFWDKLADHYYDQAEMDRPPQTRPQRRVVAPQPGGTKPPAKGATPGSPNPKGAP